MGEMLSVRVSEEIQSKFKSLAESSDSRNQGEFLSSLLALYAAQETGAMVPTLDGAVSAVTDMAERVCRILVGTGETVLASQAKAKEQIEAHRQETGEKMKAINEENRRLSNALDELAMDHKNAEKALDEAEERINGLERSLRDKTDLIEEYREKIDKQGSEIDRQNKIIASTSAAIGELDALKAAVKELEHKIEQAGIEKEKALGELEKANRNEMAGQQARHAAEISAYEKKILEKDREIIEIEKGLRHEMTEQQKQYASSVKEYEDRVKSMLDEISARPPVKPPAKSKQA